MTEKIDGDWPAFTPLDLDGVGLGSEPQTVISQEYAAELARQVDELEEENEQLRDALAARSSSDLPQTPRKPTSASPCLNCGDPSDELFCGTCREMGCSIPQAPVTREALAQIIDPKCFIIPNSTRFEIKDRQRDALAKADAILAMFSLKITEAEIMSIGDTVTTLRKMAPAKPDQTAYQRAWEVYVDTSMDPEETMFGCIKRVVDAVIDEIGAAQSSEGTRETPSPWDMVAYQRLRAMPSSLNDACRTMDLAAAEIDRLYGVLEDLAIGFESARDRCSYVAEARRLDNCAKFCRGNALSVGAGASSEPDQAIKDAHEHLKTGIAALKASNNHVPMELHKAAHALGYAIEEQRS